MTKAQLNKQKSMIEVKRDRDREHFLEVKHKSEEKLRLKRQKSCDSPTKHPVIIPTDESSDNEMEELMQKPSY